MESMKKGKQLYLDVCALQRPYDDLAVIRNEIEAAAVYLILSLSVLGEYVLYHSPVHDMEIKRNSDPVVTSALISILENLAKDIKPMIKPDALVERVRGFMSRGIKNLDALHLAHAEQAGAAFISCDDDLLKKSKKEKLDIWTGDPIDFLRSEGRL
jgi:hypothetical protein